MFLLCHLLFFRGFLLVLLRLVSLFLVLLLLLNSVQFRSVGSWKEADSSNHHKINFECGYCQEAPCVTVDRDCFVKYHTLGGLWLLE